MLPETVRTLKGCVPAFTVPVMECRPPAFPMTVTGKSQETLPEVETASSANRASAGRRISTAPEVLTASTEDGEERKSRETLPDTEVARTSPASPFASIEPLDDESRTLSASAAARRRLPDVVFKEIFCAFMDPAWMDPDVVDSARSR